MAQSSSFDNSPFLQAFQAHGSNFLSYTLILTQDRISTQVFSFFLQAQKLTFPRNLAPSTFVQVKPQDQDIQEMPNFFKNLKDSQIHLL